MVRRRGRGLAGTGSKSILLWAGLLLSPTLLGQPGDGAIQGRILGVEGQPLPQAWVLLLEAGAGSPREVTPDGGGGFRFLGLEPGVYRLEAGAQGYLSQVREGIQLRDGASLEVTLILEAGRSTLREAEERGAGERNPNIFIRRLGLSTLRDPLRRRGIEPVALQFDAGVNNHGVDLGAPLREIAFVRGGEIERSFHGSLHEFHQNSVLNARPFFNVGPLRPSKRNQFGLNLGGPLGSDRLFFDTSLDFVRESGFVNGNIRVPLAGERTPLTDDPEKAAVVATLLQAYPTEEPNLPDVTPRQLNTNAIRRIRSLEWDLKLDYQPARSDRLAFQYSLFDYTEDPFELVIGQNPRTENRPQTFAAEHAHTWSPRTLLRSSFQFDRVNSLLVPTERFQQLVAPLGLEGPTIDFGGGFADLTAIGPDRQFPRQRVQNRFSGNLDLSLRRGRHQWRVGGRTTRVQVNDLQSNDLRGTFTFSGSTPTPEQPEARTAVDNFRRGEPISFTIAFGDLYRGFRTWEHALFLQDTLQLAGSLTLTLGIRYEAILQPGEINDRIPFFYESDLDNYGPLLGLAWAAGPGTTLRAGYGIAYGHIFPDIYQRIRFNAPAVRVIPVFDPDLIDPLRSLDSIEEAPTEVTRLTPDLNSQYAHQYNLVIQQNLPWNLFFEIGYVGNRTKGPFFPFISNLARPVPGIPTTSATIQERRPDPRFGRILTVGNAGTFSYDALRVGLTRAFGKGLGFDLDYIFSKALESASNFISTFNREAGFLASQSTDDIFNDVRGPSAFDHRHILAVRFRYDLPSGPARGFSAALLDGWSVSAVTEYHSGSWFTVTTSSDGPGFGNVDGFGSDRANILDPRLLGRTVDHPDTSRSILRPELFNSDLPPGGLGNIPRAAFRSDPISNTNLSLAKAFPLAGGEQSLRVRAEFQNLLNHAHFSKPGDVFPSQVFGRIVDTENKGRVIQIGLIWSF